MSVQWEIAACAGTDPSLWFPDSMWNLYGQSTSRLRQQVRVCRSICAGCPIMAECLEHAVSNHEHGIWAGTTTSQRKAIRKRRRIQGEDLARTA